MTAGFDINDRRTWAWTDSASWPDLEFWLDPDSPGSFFQRSAHGAVRQPCPAGLVFNPTVETGPVCDWPAAVEDAAVYAWAVAHGQVTDQR